MDRKNLHDIVNLVTIATGMAKKSLESMESNNQSQNLEDAKIKLTKSLNALARLENLLVEIRYKNDSEVKFNTQNESNTVQIQTLESKVSHPDKLTILVVDDEDDIRDLIIEELTNQNFKTIYAKDGREGFSQFIQYRPDLVISDINMPHLSGIEMAQLIYNKNNNVKFIFLGGDLQEQTILSLPFAQSLKLMNKPFDFDQLNEYITTFLKAS